MKIPIKKFDHPRPPLELYAEMLASIPGNDTPQVLLLADAVNFALALEAHHKEETEWMIAEIKRLEARVAKLESGDDHEW